MYFADALTLDAGSRSRTEGYLKVRARSARTGVYQYSGREVDPDNTHGLRDQASVNVLRDAEAVFERASLASFIAKPITDDHPTEAVTRDNWRNHGRGVIMGAVQDGEYVGFDLAFLDGPTIDKIDGGKVELSNGYTSKLEFGDFTAADGTKCQARQTQIRGNHIALVERGRAGSECRVIADAATCDTIPLPKLNDQEKPVKTMLIDGLTVDVSNADTAMATIQTLVAARDAALGKVTTAEAKTVEDAATIVAKDAQIAKLTADLAAAKPTLQQLRDAGKAFAVIEGKAKAAGVTVTDAMDEVAIMKAVVDKAMPGNAYEGEHVRIAFDALTKDHKPSADTILPLGEPRIVTDDQPANDARAKMIADMVSPTAAAA